MSAATRAGRDHRRPSIGVRGAVRDARAATRAGRVRGGFSAIPHLCKPDRDHETRIPIADLTRQGAGRAG